MTTLEELDLLLETAPPEVWENALTWALSASGTESGTVHLVGDDGLLHLAAHSGIPAPVLEAIRRIPFGKGMAGLAAERREPVSLCNLQTDGSGDARPGARATGLRGTIALPLLAGEGEEARVVGTLGVGSHEEREFTSAETELLVAAGRRIAARVVRDG